MSECLPKFQIHYEYVNNEIKPLMKPNMYLFVHLSEVFYMDKQFGS